MTRILLIDDDSSIREITRRVLAGVGYDVVAADSAAAGMRIWREQGADLVVTDLRLGDASGFDIVRELRTIDAALPVIITSGDTGGSAAQLSEALDSGNVSVLKKPFRSAELLNAVRTALHPPEPLTHE